MKPDINKVRAGLEHCSAPDVYDGCPYLERVEFKNALIPMSLTHFWGYMFIGDCVGIAERSQAVE